MDQNTKIIEQVILVDGIGKIEIRMIPFVPRSYGISRDGRVFTNFDFIGNNKERKWIQVPFHTQALRPSKVTLYVNLIPRRFSIPKLIALAWETPLEPPGEAPKIEIVKIPLEGRVIQAGVLPWADSAYAVSEGGLVFSRRKRGHGSRLGTSWALVSLRDDGAYLKVNMTVAGERVNSPVHRLVASAWINGGRPLPKGFVVNHRDHDRFNNNASNLEIVTQSENIRHAHVAGRFLRSSIRPSLKPPPPELEIRGLSWLPDYGFDIDGRVYSKKIQGSNIESKRLVWTELRLGRLPSGYRSIRLRVDGKTRSFLVHRLVASAWLNGGVEISLDLVVNHIDYNQENNRVENLELISHSENTTHGFKGEKGKHYVKYNDELIQPIPKLKASGLTNQAVADKVGIPLQLVYAILSGRTRSDVSGIQPKGKVFRGKPNLTLTEDDVREIVRLYKIEGMTQLAIAEYFRVSRVTIRSIIVGRTWSWLTGISKVLK